jgi:pimeloyl-ACP methyl ester carboxylesterase
MIHFKDDLYDAQLLRALAAVYYGGADVGDCMATARRIRELDADSWFSEWWRTAERCEHAGDASLRDGHRVSAREMFLRAGTYFRTALIFLIGTPDDARLAQAFERHTRAFRKAGALFDPPFEAIAIPYEGTTLPGYFFRVDATNTPRPTLIINGGYDSSAEEGYCYTAAAALRRGYNCLSFDGPGQGGALIGQGLVFRADWECVIAPVVDYVLRRRETDPDRIALMGASFGGYLAPRAASHERRLAACIADPGQFDLFAAFKARMPGFLARQLPNGNGLMLSLLRRVLERMRRHPTKGWGLRRGLWVHGVSTPLDYVRLTQEYTLRGHAEQIACPTLVCFAESDPIAAQAPQLFAALQCPKQYLTFTSAEGAGEHCEGGNRSLFHQRVFDWLDATLGVAS